MVLLVGDGDLEVESHIELTFQLERGHLDVVVEELLLKRCC